MGIRRTLNMMDTKQALQNVKLVTCGDMLENEHWVDSIGRFSNLIFSPTEEEKYILIAASGFLALLY